MKYIIMLAVVLFAFVGMSFADSTAVAEVSRPQRVDTIKPYIEMPSWALEVSGDTSKYVKRNCLMTMRFRWVNPGAVVVMDTIVSFRPNIVGIDTLRYVPRIIWRFHR